MNNKTTNCMKCILYLFGTLTVALPVQAASFDCAKAGTKVEHLICNSPEISKLDDELAKAYKTALQDRSKAESVRQAQKQWLMERNKCVDASCVKQSYDVRLTALTLISSSKKGEINTNSQNGQQYHFQLTKGAGAPVCDAYLKRLNVTQYKEPPFCGRPENDSVKGFSKLNRVPVSAVVLNDLYPIVSTFMSLANQKNLNWSDMNLQKQIVSRNKGTPTTMQDMLNRNSKWAKVWRYEPPIDIDNDGMPDNVEIWYGNVLPSGVGGRTCGADMSDKFPGSPPLHQPQIAFVITASNDRLDVAKTESVFAHPTGGYRLSNSEFSTNFRPIGRSIGIFKYGGIYYFDTFFDGWGDFENKRQNDKNIINTLAVFQHKNGKTEQVCQYVMMDKKNKGEAK